MQVGKIMQPTKQKLPYRRCAGIMLLNKSGKVFVARRIDTAIEAWQMPQGGIDEGEKPLDAATRELEEETGVTNVSVIGEYEEWLTYDLPDDLYGKVWKGKYGGQTMKWFVMRYNGEDSEINIETEHAEFSIWKWAEMSTLENIIIPFKKEIYKKLAEKFKDLAEP